MAEASTTIASLEGAVSTTAGAAAPSQSHRRRTATVPVDVMIPTFNERENLPHALASVIGWAHRVFVLDSESTDGTPDIARQMGATVIQHPWEGYARQKNWGIDNLPFESPWVFILDADEVLRQDLKDEIAGICARPPGEVGCDGYYVNRCLIFLDKPIKHCGYFPSWNLRLFKRGRARYEDRPVHEHMLLHGKAGFLKGLMDHEDRRGLEYYIAKHNRYSTLEAEVIHFAGRHPRPSSLPARVFGNALERRRFLKDKLYPKMPAKWLWRFVWMYFIKLGFLDGVNGLRFCLLISTHELFTSLKLRELRQRDHFRTPAVPDGQGGLTEAAVAAAAAAAIETAEPAGVSTASDTDAAAAPAAPEGTDSLAVTVLPLDRNHRPAPIETTAVQLDPGQLSRPVPGAVTFPKSPTAAHGTVRKESSTWSFKENVKRALWMTLRVFLFRTSFHNWYAWRRFLLRRFGARIGRDVRIRPTALIEIPWNLDIGDRTVVGDYAILYSLGTIKLGHDVVVSQYAHLCAGTHDYTSRRFPLLRLPIEIGDEAWVAADVFVGPGVTIGARAVVGARSTVTRDVPANAVVAGTPARYIKERVMRE